MLLINREPKCSRPRRRKVMKLSKVAATRRLWTLTLRHLTSTSTTNWPTQNSTTTAPSFSSRYFKCEFLNGLFDSFDSYGQMGKQQEALNDCNQAIALDDLYIKAYLRRAKCCMDLEKFEEAVRDYEKINKLEKNRGKLILLMNRFMILMTLIGHFRLQAAFAGGQVSA